MEKMPVEILIKIFNYLPSYNEICLVNKLFHRIASACSDSNWVSFRLTANENRPLMNSINETEREISKLAISLDESSISDAVTIITKFSATIKYFRLKNSTMELADLLEILSLLPNVQHLELVFVRMKKKQSVPMPIGNGILNLRQVKNLILNECSLEFLVVFNRLPADVLEELTIAYWNLDLNILSGLFAQQSKLLLIDNDLYDVPENEKKIPDRIFQHLKLESLEIFQYDEYNSTNTTILSNQNGLTSLRLRTGEVDRDVLNVITTKLTGLKVLDVRVSSTSIVPFRKIANLKDLTDLTLHSSSLELLQTLASLDNSRILTLSLQGISTMVDEEDEYDPPMPIDVISTLANSLPNLKALEFNYYCNDYECELIGAIMQNFNYVEILDMNFGSIIDSNRIAAAIDIERCFNSKLTDLRINNEFLSDEPIVTKLVSTYPNLKTLSVESSKSLTTAQLKLILVGFKKMESLALYVKSSTTDHLECIKSHKNNLKFVALHGFNIYKLSVDQDRISRSIFDHVRFSCGRLQMSCEKFVNE